MFIRLIPSPPHSAVLFAVAFPDLDNISLPPSWVDQLRILQHDHLEIPSSIHVLDRAAGLVCIITEITFDVPALTISCKMVDGSIEEWPLVENGCLDALSGVVSDVNESAEMERVTELENEKRRAESPTGKVTRHKKQRSLLMTLVAQVQLFFLYFSKILTLFLSVPLSLQYHLALLDLPQARPLPLSPPHIH